MRTRRVLDRVVVGCLATVMVIVAVSCSSDGSATGLDLGTTVATSVSGPTTTDPPAPTTQQPVAPTDPPTTPGLATTVAEPAITDPPTTTVPETSPPVESKEDKVRADYTAAVAARADCTYEPFTCDYSSVAIPGSPMDVQTHQVVEQRIRDNLRGKSGYGGIDVTLENVGFEGEDAFVTVCAYDTGVLFDIQDPLNADDDIVVDDNKNSYRVRWQMSRSGDHWLLYEGLQSERLNEGNLCVAE